MKKRNKVKKQHYVPRFYLKNWADKKEKIWVFNKNNQENFKASIKDVASSKYFYDVPKQIIEELKKKELINDNLKFLEQKQIFEESLSLIEMINSKIIKDIINNAKNTFTKNIYKDKDIDNILKIKEKYKKELSFFLAIQYLRTKEARITFEQLYIGTLTKIMEKIMGIEFDNYSQITLDNNHLQIFHLDILFNSKYVEEIAYLLEDYHWQLLINKTKHSFYTSDSPVVYYPNIKNKNSFQGYGFATFGISIYYPISPEFALLITEKNFFNKIKKFLKYKNIVLLQKENVIFYNDLIVHNSTQQIFSNKNNFDLAKKRIKESPFLTDINRKRIEFN